MSLNKYIIIMTCVVFISIIIISINTNRNKNIDYELDQIEQTYVTNNIIN